MKTADEILDMYYLDARCMLVELAALLDRYDRALTGGSTANGSVSDAAMSSPDPRLQQVLQTLEQLSRPCGTANRSEQVLNLFSDLDSGD